MLEIRHLLKNMTLNKMSEKFSNYIALYVLLLMSFATVEVSNFQMVDTNFDLLTGDAFFEITFPSDLEYTYRIKPARDFGAPFNSSFKLNNVKLVPLKPIEGCKIPTNIDEVEGNVAFAERGRCSFLHKTIIAEKAGAKAIIITEAEKNLGLDITSDDYIEMIADKSNVDANIPAGFLLARSGIYILKTLKRLHLSHAMINIPLNLTFVPLHKMNQPPWVSW